MTTTQSTSATTKKSSSLWTIISPFAIGGFSGMTATMIVQPVDMIKVRIQIKSEELAKKGERGKISPFAIINEIKSQYGIKGFYKGLDSALARQVFYTTTRLGIYRTLFNYLKEGSPKELSMAQKSLCAVTAGFIGSLVGNPADLALVRMQADTALPEAEKRNYKNVFNAFSRIASEEGFFSLWRGCGPTVIRAMVLNLGMLAPYDEVKERLNKWSGTKDTQRTRLTASAFAGFLSAFMSLPFDNAKTKLQKMKIGADGIAPYKGLVDCILKTTSTEGVQRLWVGFPTYYFRIAPHVMITLLTQDFLTGVLVPKKH